MPEMLADDWVRFAILAPLSSTAPKDVLSHSIGPIRQAIVDLCPPWGEEFQATLRLRPKSVLVESLRSLSEPLEAAISGIILTPLAFWPSFWEYVAAFLPSLAVCAPKSRTPRLVPFNDGHGISLSLSQGISGESRIMAAWGALHPCSSVLTVINTVHGASSSSIVAGAGSRKYLLLGPLAHLRHACETHANLVADLTRGAPLEANGLTQGAFKGCFTTSSVEEGEPLTFCHSQSLDGDDSASLVCLSCLHLGEEPAPLSPPPSPPPAPHRRHLRLLPYLCQQRNTRPSNGLPSPSSVRWR